MRRVSLGAPGISMLNEMGMKRTSHILLSSKGYQRGRKVGEHVQIVL